MDKIKAGVVVATGYAGAELCRLIIGHPEAELSAISSVSFEGKALSEVYPAYFHMCDVICGTQEQVVEQSNVIFAALPHGLSQELAAECMRAGKVFIDLGADFRLESEDEYQEWYGGSFTDKALHNEAVYGLPELFRLIHHIGDDGREKFSHASTPPPPRSAGSDIPQPEQFPAAGPLAVFRREFQHSDSEWKMLRRGIGLLLRKKPPQWRSE